MRRVIAIAGLLLMGGEGFASEPGEEARSVIFIAGQSREEFDDYVENVVGQGLHLPLPAGATIYTSLTGSGLDRPHANEPGDHHQDLRYLLRTNDPLLIQVGLWLSRDELFAIAEGREDVRVQALAQRLGTLGRPVFVRIGYEFDGPHNRYPPEAFVNAYRAMARAMRAYPSILLVWHSFALLPTYQEHDVMAWYPGDEYVDWIAVSFFQVDEDGYFKGSNRDRLVAIARQKGKPLMVAEASAVRYTQSQKRRTGEAYWDAWYEPFFRFIETNEEVRAVSMINVDWDSQRQHAFLDWGDCRIQSDPVVLDRWRERLKAPYWIHRHPRLYNQAYRISGKASPPAASRSSDHRSRPNPEPGESE